MIQNFASEINIFPARGNFYDNLFNTIKNGVEWDRSIKSRKTASYGVPYNYSNLTYAYQPFPGYLENICSDLKSRIHYKPNNCLINFYDANDSAMGYHADRTDILSPLTGITILSLGNRRTMRFKNLLDEETKDLIMEPGWFLHMSAAMQNQWHHSILPLKEEDKIKERISLTFRKLVPF